MTDDDAAMLLFGVRYCLGRHSYAPSLCCGVLRRRWPDLKPGDRDVVLRDVRREAESEVSNELDPGNLDRETWRRFLIWAEAQPA